MFVQFFLRYTSLVFINWSSPIQVLFSWAISSPIVAILNCFVLPWLGHYIQQHAYMITQAIECTSQNKHALRLKLYSIGWVLIDCTVWCKVHSFAWSDSRSSAFSQQHLCITGVYMLETFFSNLQYTWQSVVNFKIVAIAESRRYRTWCKSVYLIAYQSKIAWKRWRIGSNWKLSWNINKALYKHNYLYHMPFSKVLLHYAIKFSVPYAL